MPVEIRARVTQLLQGEALPRLRAWLLAKTDISNQTSCRYEVIYHEADDKLEYTKSDRNIR